MVTADGYLRISLDLAGQGLGVSRQEQDVRAYIARQGWTVGAVHVDNDVSASRYGSKPRKGYRALLTRIEGHECDRVVVWDIDRLLRQPSELEALIDSVEHSTVEVHNLNGDINLRSADGRFIARILVAKAAKEADDVSRRQKRKHQQLAEDGLPSGGGRRAFGFERDGMTLCDVEAAALRGAARGVLAGESLASIVRRWNAEGPPPVGGGIWRTNAVRKALLWPRTAGLREHQGRVVGDAAWPAILDRITWERVRAVLTDPSRRRNTNARRHVLSGGLIVCGRCACRLVGKPRAPGVAAYACLPRTGGCGRLYVVAEPVEALVVDAVVAVVDTGRVPGPDRADDDGLRELVARLEDDRAFLAEQWASGDLTRLEWVRARQALDARLTEARRALVRRDDSAVREFLGRGASLAGEWAGLGLERQRAIVATFVDRVVVHPPTVRGRGYFDPGRVEIRWVE